MEDKEPKQRIYEDLGLEGAGVSYESFSKKFDSDPEARKSVYKDLGLEQAGVDYQTFETKMFGEKKTAIGNATPTGGKVGASEIPSTGNETAELLGYKKPLQVPSPLIKQPKAEIGVNNIEKQKSDQYRPDGTKKDIGFLGVLKTPSGKDVTEYSVGVPVGGKEMDIPTLVPTLTEQEKRYIINRAENGEAIGRDPIGDAIVGKAIKHAEQRIKEGKSPYFSSNETLTNLDENQPIRPKGGVDKTALEDYNRTYDIYKNRDKWMSEVIQNDVLNHYVTSGGVLGDIVNVASGVISAPNYKKAEEDFKKTPAYAKLYGIKKKAENEFYAAKAKADKEVEAQSENIANQLGGWGKIVTENGNADVDKIREGVDSFLDKNGIPTDSPIAYKLRNEIKGKAEFKRIEPEIETQFDVEYKKAFGVTPEQDIQKEYGVQIEQAKTIKEAKIALEKQRAVQNEALKNEYKPEYEALGGQYKAKTEELNLAIENDPELNSFAQSLNNDVFQKYQAAVDGGQMTAEQANQEMNSPKNQDAVKAEVLKKVNEKYGKQYESAFTEYQKQINEVATRYNLAHRQQEERRVSEANQKIQAEVEKLKGQFKVSNELIERRKKAYLEAYKNVSEKQNLAKEAAGRSLNFTTQAGLSLLMGLGGGLKGYGAEFDNKTLYDIGESLESNFDIKVGESKDFSDWLDSSKLTVGTGNIIGRMVPGIALTAAAAALTKDWNLTSRLATTSVIGFTSESSDMAGTIKNDVLEKTGDPAKADKAARDMWRSQLYLFPLYGLEGAPYIGEFYTILGKKIAPKLFAEAAKGSRKTFGQWAKEAAAKSVGAGAAGVVPETPQEFLQNINEEAIRNGKEIGNIADQIDVYSEGASMKGLKETFVQIAPPTFLMGGTPVFVSDVYNGAKQKYYERAVDNYVNSESISASLETSPEQYLFNVTADKGSNFAGTLLNTLYTSGKISEVEFDNLSQKMANMDAFNKLSKKAGMKEDKTSSLVGYRLYDQYLTANESFEKEQDPIAKEVLKAKADESKKNLTEYLQGSGVNVGIMTLANGQQFVFTPEELKFALQFENIRNSLKNKEIGLTITTKKGEENQSKQTIDELNEMLKEPVSVSEEIKKPVVEREEVKPMVTEVQFTTKQRERRDQEIEEVQQLRSDLGQDVELINDIPSFVDDVVDRIDLGMMVAPEMAKDAILELDKQFDKLQAYRNDPSRTHTTAQIDAMIDVLGAVKSEIQDYQIKQKENGQQQQTTATKTEPTTTPTQGVEAGKDKVAPTTEEEKGESSVPGKTDKAYQEAQGVTERISKAHPEASVLIIPKGDDLSLTALYVGKEKRGKGIGSGVLESVKAEADKLGKKVVLDATNELDSETDLERLGNFYERNGFVKVGENKFEYTPKATPQAGSVGVGDIEAKKDELERKYGKRFSNEETYYLIKGTDGNYYINHGDRGKSIKSYKFQTEEQAKKFAEKEGIELLTIVKQGVGFTSENKAKYDAELKAAEELIGQKSAKSKAEAVPNVEAGSVGVGGDVLPKYKNKSIAERFDKGLDATSVFEGGEINPEDVTQRAAWRSMGQKEFEGLLGGNEIGGSDAKKGNYFGDNPAIASSQKGEGKYLVEFGGKRVEGETTIDKVSAKDITGIWKYENEKWNKLSKEQAQSLQSTPQAGSFGVGGEVDAPILKVEPKIEDKIEDKIKKTANELDNIPKTNSYETEVEYLARMENNRRKRSFYEKAKGILFKGFGGNASIISDMFGSKYKYFTNNPDYAKAFSLEKEYLTQKGKVEKYETNYKKEFNTNEKDYNNEVLKHSGKKSINDLTSKDFDNFNDKLKADGYDVVIIKRNEPLVPSESYRGHSADIRNVEVEEHLILNDKAIKKISDQPSLLENNAKSISEAYHKAKADGTNPELVKAVEQSLQSTPQATENEKEPTQEENGQPLPEGVSGVRTETEERKTSAELRAEEKEVEPSLKETPKAEAELPPTPEKATPKNLLDTPVKPFTKAVDLLGKPREKWMYEATEAEAEQAKKKGTMRGSQFYPKKITAIEFAIEQGKYEKAIKEGRMTAQDAKQIIESAGLEVPKSIEDLLGKKVGEEVPQAELPQAEALEVTSTIANAVANFYAINEATKRSEKREAAKEFRQNLEKMPTVKNVFDNIKSIFAQLEAEGIITKSKDCP